MAAILSPLVEETTLTEGTGTLSLAGATVAHVGFVTAFGTGGNTFYTIFDFNNGTWEYGYGLVVDGSPDTLSRDIVLGSSAAGAKLSLGPGTKYVYVEAPPPCHASGTLTFTDLDTTPSVKNAHVFIAANSAATTIAGFDDGIAGQEIIVLATNGNTTISALSIHLPGGVNITLTANDAAVFAFDGSSWRLASVSVNG